MYEVKTNQITVGLFMHWFKHENLGVAALSIANLILIDEVMKDLEMVVRYKSFITRNVPRSHDYITDNSVEYCDFPRFRDILVNPLRASKIDLDDCDCVIDLCGGDSFADIYGWRHCIPQLFTKLVAQKKGIPFVLAPQTLGPFKSNILRRVAKKIVSNADLVFVRDNMSYIYARKELGGGENLKEVTDVAFALPYSSEKHDDNGRIRVGINVSGLLYNGGYTQGNQFELKANYPELCHTIINFFIAMKDVEVHLIPHVISDDNEVEDDYRVSKTLSQKYPGVILPKKFETPMQAKNYISKMGFFIGARMHSTIAAFSSGVPVVPISYSRKFQGLYEIYGYGYIANPKTQTADEIISLIMSAFENRRRIKHSLISKRNISE
ncbi:polysaccharide pyruvyl transferase family protein, partial [bacterium]|nr:polysaccharide pyruvyl transferase family protein [bacterium]